MQAAQSQQVAVAWDDRVLTAHSAPHFMQSSTWETVRSRGPWHVHRRGLGIDRDYPVLVFERLATGYGLFQHLPRVSGIEPGDVGALTERIRAERGTAFATKIEVHQPRDEALVEAFLANGWQPAKASQYRHTVIVDTNAMVFGMPTALFPAMGTETFGGDAFTVGLLYAAPGAGALIAALTSGWVPTIVRQGRATIIAVMGWGAAIAVFGLTAYLPLALIMLGVAGAADVISAIYRGSIVQLTAPDELRGRMGGMHTAVVASGPRLGDLEAGVVAELTSTRFSVVSGGLACIVGALLVARWAPEFMNYRYEPGEQ